MRSSSSLLSSTPPKKRPKRDGIIAKSYPNTSGKYPERVREIGEIARAATNGIDCNVLGAPGTGKTAIMRSLFQEIGDVHVVYVHGPEFLTLQGVLEHIYNRLMEILDTYKNIPGLDNILPPRSIDDLEKESRIDLLLLPLQKKNKRVIMVFDRCRIVGGSALFQYFENEDWRSKSDITNTSLIFVDEYDTPSRASTTVEFRPYTAAQAQCIMERLFPSGRKSEQFIDDFFQTEYRHYCYNFKYVLSVARSMYKDMCEKGQSIAESRALLCPDFTMYLRDALSDIAKVMVCAGFCCRTNPAKYDVRLFKRDFRIKPVSADIVENKIYVGQVLEPAGEHLPCAYMRYGEKPFKWSRFWAYVTMLHSHVQLGQALPSTEEARALGVQPLENAQVLEIKSVDGTVMVQCRAGNKLAKLCAASIGLKLKDYVVELDTTAGRKI